MHRDIVGCVCVCMYVRVGQGWCVVRQSVCEGSAEDADQGGMHRVPSLCGFGPTSVCHCWLLTTVGGGVRVLMLA